MPAKPLYYEPPQEPLNIIHRDDDLLVLSKPAGLLSVPGKAPEHADCLETRGKQEFPESLLVHRLDMDTSGIFIMAMNKKAQANLGKQFERRKIDKTYIAQVWGVPDQSEGRVDLPLRCDWENRPLQMVCYEHGRPAQTAWQVIGVEQGHARVQLKPLTGRSHQLRVHMQALGHPILGDRFYAPEEARDGLDRLYLHAHSLTLHHPKDGTLTTFTDPCPF
ncbi:MAG: RluA family pseudouridine synthase [Rhodospirillales bacterium]|nr:RluA family pseudouridine synthase [Rhodospirillales bacterium]